MYRRTCLQMMKASTDEFASEQIHLQRCGRRSAHLCRKLSASVRRDLLRPSLLPGFRSCVYGQHLRSQRIYFKQHLIYHHYDQHLIESCQRFLCHTPDGARPPGGVFRKKINTEFGILQCKSQTPQLRSSAVVRMACSFAAR